MRNLFLFLLLFPITIFAQSNNTGYVVVSDYLENNQNDISEDIQKLIEAFPSRTLYFPDGVYTISQPIKTPATPSKSVHLVFSNYAVLKASDNWNNEDGAMLQLGGIEPSNNITVAGSNYGIEGGIIEGNGKADGISINSGRETRIVGCSLKNVRIGIHIKHGANSGSSDADVRDVNIVGNKSLESVGVLVEGHDNTFSNMRIASTNVGVICNSGGNSFRDIHPLFINGGSLDYVKSCGFIINRTDNWFYHCYSDQHAVGFKLGRYVRAWLTDCFVMWYSGAVPFQHAIEATESYESIIKGITVNFSKECKNALLLKSPKMGNGVIRDAYPNKTLTSELEASVYFLK